MISGSNLSPSPLQTKGEYGSDVTKLARPLPLEYLIIELTTTTPKTPRPLLVGGKDPPFPVENRSTIGGQIQVGIFLNSSIIIMIDLTSGVSFGKHPPAH